MVMPGNRTDILTDINKLLDELQKRQEEEQAAAEKKQLKIPGLERRLKAGEDVFLTPEVIRQSGLELDIPDDWMLKISPGRDGEGPIFRYRSPGGEDLTDEDIWVDEAGKWFTTRQKEAMEAEQPAPLDISQLPFNLQPQAWFADEEKQRQFEQEIIPTLPQELRAQYANIPMEEFAQLVTEYQETKREEFTSLMEMAFPELLEPYQGEQKTNVARALAERLQEDETMQDALFQSIQSRGRTPETERLLKDLMPDITERDVKIIFGEDVVPLNQVPLGAYKVTQQPFEQVMELARKDPDGLRQAVLYEGRSPETEALLKSIYGEQAITDKYLDLYFQDTLAGKFVRGEWLPDAVEDYWKQYWGGVGDLVTMTAGAADRLGADGVADTLKRIGFEGRLIARDVEIPEKETPEWYAKNLTRMIPMMLGLIDISLATGGSATSIVASAGGGTFLQTLAGTITAGLTSSIGEGILEAGDAYQEAERRGFTEEERNAVFDKVLRNNIGLLSLSNTAQFGLTFFAPGGKLASFMAKSLVFGFDAASEGLEEGLQLAIAREALGEEQVFDEEMWQNVKLGIAGGLGFAGLGAVYNGIQSRIEGKMETSQYDQLRKDIQTLVAQGYSRKEAEARAWDKFTETPEGEQMVQETVQEMQQEELQKAQPDVSKVEEALKPVSDQVEPFSKKIEDLVKEHTPQPEIEIGDFIQLKGEIGKGFRAPRGFVVGEGIMGKDIPAWKIRQADGSETLIPKDEAVPLGKALETKAEPVREEEVPPTKVEAIPPREAPIPPVRPPQESAARTIYNRIQFEPEQEGFVDKVRRGWHRFNVKMVDDLFAIKKVTDQVQKGGVKLSIEENPYLMARLLRGVTGKANVFLETGTYGKQFWKMEKGKARPNFTGEPLENILKEVKEPEAWRDFSTYLVSRRSVELSDRGIETGISREQAETGIAEYERKYPKFPDLADRIYAYQDRLLDYGREMGLFSDDLVGKLKKYGNYVPFYRVFNELQSKGLMGKKMANIAQPIKKIKGSEREIINPLESIVKNTYVIINSADRNQIGIMLANLADKYPEVTEVFERVKTPMARVAGVTAKELGVEVEGLTDADAEAIVDIFRPSFYTRTDEVTVLIDGKKKFFRIDQDLRDALLNLDRESIGMLGRILGAPARWLRAGATLSPDFMVRNPARDQLTAFAYSNYGFLPGIDFMRGLASIIAKDADYQLFRASGAEHSMLVSMDREYLQKSFKELTEGRGFTTYVKHPVELLRIISELGEKATRLGEFKAGIRRGAVPLEAGYSARSVTLDFSQMGTTAKAVNTLIAFWNANIRGWGKMLSSFKEHPVRTSAKVFMGITLPSILLYLANRDDDRWAEIPQWQKDLFWIVMTPDNIYRIPKPFELGIIFGSMPERFLEWLDTKDPKMFKESLSNLAEAGSPGFIPTAGLPILEWMTNYSFFRGYSIVPASREKMPPELQYGRYTSEVSKKLGELLKLPPAKIDNLINGYTGGLGNYLVDGLDAILKKTGISPDIPRPEPTLADTPVTKAFVVRNPYGSSGETVESFYNTLEEYQEGEQYLKEMLKLGEQEKFETYKAAHPELLFFYEFPEDPEKEGVFYSATARYLRRVARDLSELSKKQDEVYKARDISSKEKRRLIDEMDVLKTEIARKALNLLIGEESQVMQEAIDSAVNRLGEVIEEPPVLSLEEPDIFDMRKLRTEFGRQLEAVTPEDLSRMEGIDPLALAYMEVKEAEKQVDPIPNQKIYEIKPDLREGVTFESYYNAWKQGIFEDETFDQLSRRQLELLNEYHKLDKPGQTQFLIDNPELKINPRQEWLKSHPDENAQLAIWGQARILTREAYTKYLSLLKELDIPDAAIPEQTLPPEGSVDNYFTYQELIDERSANSWETQLLLSQDDALREWLGREPIETPIESLQLKIKHRDLYDLAGSYSDKDSPNYIENDKARQEAIKQLKADNPEWVDDMRRVEAIEHKGSELQESWVERGKLVDQFTAGSSEALVWLMDHPDVHQWALEQELLTDDGSDWNEPVLRINARWRKEDEEYEAIKMADETAQRQARLDYLQNHEEYHQDRRRREAYSATGPKDETYTPEQIEQYVAYYEISEKGMRQERYLLENPEFAQAMHTIAGIDIPEKVPSVQYDDIYDQYQAQFERLEGLADNKSEHYIEDTKERARAREALRFKKDGNLTEFGKAEIRRTAYGTYVPDKYVERYVDYYSLLAEGTPADWPQDRSGNRLTWYEDDWYLIEHPAFYEDIYLGHLGLEKRDFSKVPSRTVFRKYAEYVNLIEGKPREDYRWENRDLDEWLLLTKKVTVPIKEKRRRAALTPSERMREELAEIEKRLRER